MAEKRILHVGCGTEATPEWLPGVSVRLDIDPGVEPDIVASILDLGPLSEFDVVYCSHTLEHVYPHEVSVALGEFRRVLKDGGAVLIFVPDLEDQKPTDDVLYNSDAGPVTGFDLFYGYRPFVEMYPNTMAHHCGFVSSTMRRAMEDAGFGKVTVQRIPCCNLFAAGMKNVG
jgi:SAM-dependent methyltransferase